MSSLLVFIRVYRLEIYSVILVFSTVFVDYCPSNLLSDCSSILYTRKQGVNGGGRIGSKVGRGPQADETPAAQSLYR
jgi:hypothetical protein